jgi:Bifunctional DNA primase/polymerase, N-terminal
VNPVLNAAMTYTDRGWQVLPLHTPTTGRCTCDKGPGCDSTGKHPRVRWPAGQLVDEGQVTRWWHRWPLANVGIVTGAVSGILVLDVDPKNGGSDSLAELDRRYRLTATTTVITRIRWKTPVLPPPGRQHPPVRRQAPARHRRPSRPRPRRGPAEPARIRRPILLG